MTVMINTYKLFIYHVDPITSKSIPSYSCWMLISKLVTTLVLLSLKIEF